MTFFFFSSLVFRHIQARQFSYGWIHLRETLHCVWVWIRSEKRAYFLFLSSLLSGSNIWNFATRSIYYSRRKWRLFNKIEFINEKNLWNLLRQDVESWKHRHLRLKNPNNVLRQDLMLDSRFAYVLLNILCQLFCVLFFHSLVTSRNSTYRFQKHEDDSPKTKPLYRFIKSSQCADRHNELRNETNDQYRFINH